ncbi:unnamed protein product, partial [Prorocentrum cordatum]
ARGPSSPPAGRRPDGESPALPGDRQALAPRGSGGPRRAPVALRPAARGGDGPGPDGAWQFAAEQQREGEQPGGGAAARAGRGGDPAVAARRAANQAAQPHRPGSEEPHEKPAVVIPADLEAARVTALSGGGLSGCTTVRLKNVEPSLMPATAIAALNANGFEGMFDFVHVPMDMKRMKNRGILFINLIDPATADAMYQSFHHQTMPGVSLAGKTLEITPAYVQGFKENFDLHVESEAPFLECFRCVL